MFALRGGQLSSFIISICHDQAISPAITCRSNTVGGDRRDVSHIPHSVSGPGRAPDNSPDVSHPKFYGCILGKRKEFVCPCMPGKLNQFSSWSLCGLAMLKHLLNRYFLILAFINYLTKNFFCIYKFWLVYCNNLCLLCCAP